MNESTTNQLFAAGWRCQGQSERPREAALYVPDPQGLQRVPGTPAQLQELVHRLLHVSLHPALPLLLGRQPQPLLDLLFHWNPLGVERRPNRALHFVGQGDGGRCVFSTRFFLSCNNRSPS